MHTFGAIMLLHHSPTLNHIHSTVPLSLMQQQGCRYLAAAAAKQGIDMKVTVIPDDSGRPMYNVTLHKTQTQTTHNHKQQTHQPYAHQHPPQSKHALSTLTCVLDSPATEHACPTIHRSGMAIARTVPPKTQTSKAHPATCQQAHMPLLVLLAFILVGTTIALFICRLECSAEILSIFVHIWCAISVHPDTTSLWYQSAGGMGSTQHV
jgi:hypothetical protein